MSAIADAAIPAPVKVGYGAAAGATAMVTVMVQILFLFFLTDVVKMEPAYAGFILGLATFWEAILSPAIGIGSDRLTTRWGRRRPFIITMAVPFALISWLIFTDPGLGPTGTRVYFTVMALAYFACFALIEVPHLALAAEMTQDYNERTSLIGYRAAWGQLGSIAGSALPLLLVGSVLAPLLGSETRGWSATGAFFGLLSLPLILGSWRMTRGYETPADAVHITPKEILSALFQNRPFRYTVGVYTFGVLGGGICAPLIVYFMTYVLGLDALWKSLAFLVLFSCGMLWVPVINATSARLGKRWCFAIYVGIWALIQGIGIMVIGPDTWWVFFILLFVASSGVVSLYMIGLTMIADVVEVDEFKSGQRREGLYFGAIVFVHRICQAFTLWGIGIALSWFGYVANADQIETALNGIRYIYGFGPALALGLSVVFVYFLPVTKKNHDALREAMRLKKEGKPYDEESIRELIR